LNAEVEINSAWKTKIRENIKILAKESLSYYEFRKHKPVSHGLTKDAQNPADISGIKRGNI
jgi:hypothetical protein